ncbi:ubiquitin thiolesterase [Grosmannia clavigera kw1407]|uniref:ubiquitinyl hydrolase 1 n=1 Tax=Grosmannia clavigera (strain kw1407 / UAMH 11150) TaxID=655863 RepID=F0XJ82_GROCL|nr:ubiquitin thiolesterase [Grosmannia clavigera kw1407]EFX02271.1 ubiquitin thiolesterase [Grosmannia clavigera kw1407]
MQLPALTPVEITVEFTDVASFQRLQLLQRQYKEQSGQQERERQERQEREEEQRQQLEYEQPYQLHYQNTFLYQQPQFQQQQNYHYDYDHQQLEQLQQLQLLQQPQYPPPTQHQHQQALFYRIHQHAQAPAASAAAPPQPISSACDDSGDGAGGLCDEPNRCRNRSAVPAGAMVSGAASHVAAVNYVGCATSSYTALAFPQHQRLPCGGCTANGSYHYGTINADFATAHHRLQQPPPQQSTATRPALVSSATSLAVLVPPAAVFLSSNAASSPSAPPHPHSHSHPHPRPHPLALPSSPLQLRHCRLRLAPRRQAKAKISHSQPHASLYRPLALDELHTPLPHPLSAMAVDLPEMTGDNADHIAADIATQEALARDYQPDVTGPAVGSIQSTDVVKEHYATADAAFAEKTGTLPDIFPLYRSILGDAIGFCYFEALIHTENMDRIKNERSRLQSLNDYIRDVGHYNPYVYEDMVEETDNLFVKIINAMPETDKAATALTNIFNDANSGNAIIYHLRLLVASYLKGNALLYQDFLIHPDGLEGYCQEYIERPNCEIDHVRIEILANILLKPPDIVLEIAYLDRSVGSNVPLYRFPQENNNREENSIDLRISLLFRPDHYDILYRPGLPFASVSAPGPQAFAQNPSGSSPDASAVHITPARLAEEGGNLDSKRLEPVEGAAVHTTLSGPPDTAGGQAAAAETPEPPLDPSSAESSVLNPPSSTDLHVHHTRVDFESLFPSNTSSLENYANLDMRVLSLIPGMMTTASARPNYSSSLGLPSGQPELSQSPWAASTKTGFGGSLCTISASESHASILVHLAVAESPSMASVESSVAAVGPALEPVSQYAGRINNNISMEGAPVSYSEVLDPSAELSDSVHLHAQRQMHLPPHHQQQFHGGHTPEPAESHPVRFTKWQYERTDIDINNPEPGFLRSSRSSTAHFSNPEFQPEEYQPAGEDGKLGNSRSRRKARRLSSENAPRKT